MFINKYDQYSSIVVCALACLAVADLGVQMHPLLRLVKVNVSLLFSSFGFVPIIIFSVQHWTSHLELVSNAVSVKFVVGTHLNSMESKRVVPFQLFYLA